MASLNIVVPNIVATKLVEVYQSAGYSDAQTWIIALLKQEYMNYYVRKAIGGFSGQVQGVSNAAKADVDADFG